MDKATTGERPIPSMPINASEPSPEILEKAVSFARAKLAEFVGNSKRGSASLNDMFELQELVTRYLYTEEQNRDEALQSAGFVQLHNSLNLAPEILEELDSWLKEKYGKDINLSADQLNKMRNAALRAIVDRCHSHYLMEEVPVENIAEDLQSSELDIPVTIIEAARKRYYQLQRPVKTVFDAIGITKDDILKVSDAEDEDAKEHNEALRKQGIVAP